MSQTVITTVFEQWKAAQAANGQAVVLDEFVFANVPNLDVNAPINRAEVVPPSAQIVYRQAVEKAGVVNQNAVVYSVTLGADVGDFSFNWIGLINKATGKLAMVVHAPLQSKVKNVNGQQGNVLTRSFLMEYNGAENQTLISTPAETWQIDFTARLAGMDESLRLANLDVYGAGAFFDNGFLVSKTGTQFFVSAGLGYVGGLRANLAAKTNITVTTKPMTVWADVSYQGTLTSEYKTAIKFKLATTLKDYIQNGVAHYVFALASIDTNGVITDLRPKGSSLYLRRDKNLADIADPAAGLNTLNGVPKTRSVNKKALAADITLTPADVGAISNVMANVDNTTVTKIYDPSIVSLSGGVTLAGYFDDHPLGATFQAADTVVTHRRWYNAGAALTQYLHCRTGTIYVRIGNVSTTEATGWAWVQTSATPLPFGWRKFFDSSSLELADLTRLGVAKSGDNSDITSLGKLTSIASSVKMAANLEVASSIQANYRVGVIRTGEFEAYMSFTSRVGKVSAADLPASLTSMGNVYFRLPNTFTETDPHAGRALGGHSAAVYPTGEGVMRMDARDETGAIKARIVCDGQSDSVHISNGVLRPEWGMTLSSTNASSVIRGRNEAVILRDHNNGNVTISASLKDAGSGIGGTLYLGYNRDTANIFTSAVSIDSPLTINETMKAAKDATFAGAMTVAGEVNFNGMVKFNRHEATCQFSSSDATYPLINVSYSNAGNFGFWDATNGKWVLRKRAANLKDGTADNWVMDGGLEVTGAYGLTLSTALPVTSGGTGAKTAADALKNLGGFPRSGGDLSGRLSAYSLHLTQPSNPSAGQGTHIGWNESQSQGESIFVNNKGGGVGGFVFRVVNSANNVQSGRVDIDGNGALNTSGALSENGQRVSTQNDAQNRANIAENNARNWAYSNCVQDIRFGASTEFKERNNNENMNGGVMTSFKDAGSSNYWIRMRPLQKAVGGNWYTVGYA